MHTGLATPYRGSYVALAAHQAERVMAAAHGGQVLVTQTTADAFREEGEALLSALGRFRLRDFPNDVRLYQVRAPGLIRDFPAVRALPSGGHNVVRPPTETIGREDSIAELSAQVAPGRLITLIGPGGVGKTRVASELAMRIAPDWDDGVWMTDLAGVGQGSRVAGAVAAAVGAPLGRTTDRWDDVLRHLETKTSVLFLDNCEHLALTCRDLVTSLIAHSPGVAVVTTSRQPLHAPGERLWPVEPLATPPSRPTIEEVAASPAAKLFLQRASDHSPGFRLDEENAGTIAEICRRLDGLPLLTELAAAHVGTLALGEILSGLHRPELLTSSDPGARQRHQTLAAMLEWGLRLLSPAEQAAFRRLSIFPSGFTAEAAASALGAEADDSVSPARLVWSLVDRSLIESDQSANQTRYRFLNTIRMFGRRSLGQTEAIEVAESVAEWYLADLGPWHAADRAWMGTVGEEVDNLRALIPLLGDDHPETAQQLACTIARYHDAAQSFRDGIQEITDLVKSLASPSPARVALLTALADLYLRTGEVQPARELVEQADVLRAETGNPHWDEVGVDRSRGEIARRTGDLQGAIGVARETLTRPLADRGRSRMLNLLGTTAAALGDYETAYEACQEELELSERLGYEVYIASAHGNLAEVALRMGDMPLAARHQRACLELGLALGSQVMVAFSLVVAARVAGWDGDWEEAIVLHSRAEDLLAEIDLALYDDDARASEELLRAAMEILGSEAYDAARSHGRDLDLVAAAMRAERLLANEQSPAAAKA
jgi:predicted ATPase